MTRMRSLAKTMIWVGGIFTGLAFLGGALTAAGHYVEPFPPYVEWVFIGMIVAGLVIRRRENTKAKRLLA